jgi:hypothetical protein
LLGIDAIFDNCQSTRSAVNAAWLLSADGKEVAHGSSDTERVAGWSDKVFRGIGRFAAKRGQRYTLDVKFFSDTAPLKPTKPHLRIAALPPMNHNEFGFSLLYSLVKLAEAVCVHRPHLDGVSAAEEDSKSPGSCVRSLDVDSRVSLPKACYIN